MEIENLRQQEPNNGDPFGGNRLFRLAILGLGILAVVGVLIFLLLILGFCAPNRQASATPTAQAAATAVVIVETQAPPTVIPQQPTNAPATATLVLAAATNAPTNAPTLEPTSSATQPTATSQATTAPTAANASPTKAAGGTTKPTASTGSGATQGPLAGMYIANMRYDPPRPVRNDPVNFFATIVNRTGQDQNYPLCADVFLPDHKNPLGTTDCNMVTIPPGTNEIPLGFWIATGIKQCIPFRARAVMREQGGEARVPFTNNKGGEYWLDFSVCP